MSHQMRIDQYYKSIISTQRSNKTIGINKNSRLKDISYSRSKKKTEKQNKTHIISSDDNEINLRTPKQDLECSLEMSEIAIDRNNSMEVKKEEIIPSYDDNERLRSPNKTNIQVTNNRDSISPVKRLKYSPKVPSNKKLKNLPQNLSGHTQHNDIITKAIEHMNLAKHGAIPPNNFNLEKIYSNSRFNYQYSCINTKTSVKYEESEINFSNNLNSKILSAVIFTVLSNPVNCGYFDENEMDFIYSIVTLPVNAQLLLTCMIKRKKTWHRKSNIKYPEIASNLQPVFKLLASRSICTFDVKNENLSTLLHLLQVGEIRQLCQVMKIDSNGKKENIITKLLKLSKNKSLFPGMKSPNDILYTSIFDILDYCVCITDRTWNIIDKIITLLVPNQDPKMSIADTFFNLYDVYLGKAMFPNIPEIRFPIFSCTSHLLNYIHAKSMLFTTLESIEKKNWEKVRYYGNLAMDKLSNVLKIESLRLRNSTIPMHVRCFMPEYVWLKILSKSIEAFKKIEDKKHVLEILNFLLEQDCHLSKYKGSWYNELALIKMYHHKDVDASASVIIEALGTENLSQVDRVELLERANKIFKKKKGVKPHTKINIDKVLNDHIHQMPKYEVSSITINALSMPNRGIGNKSVWCIESNSESQSYGSVEMLASYHYSEQGFPNAVHCEGELPILLFVTLFWEEIYEIDIPGAFVTLYQYAPGDLFTEHFYDNRKEKVNIKFEIIKNFDSETLSSFMKKRFEIYKQYQSIMNSNLLKNSLQLKEIVYCLGVEGIVGICKRLIQNFKLWKAGFPDLIAWNYETKRYKIIEVKGPRDVLSTKQQLWLQYLNHLGLNTEVCLVQDKLGAKNR
ncbi:fanconi-associated nuclease 1-like [Colletes gigas]|uniref:fanconi-associated nuclease 1-like n=1 Tax=Colletes gigas TaxID=935657 RepID=UPI001C9BA202|nr:fanconi-associated nuclease 1-like [Colletes gigas]